MTSILAAAAIGAWSYAGFLAEPGPTPPSPSFPAPSPSGPVIPPAPVPPSIDREPASPPAAPARGPVARPQDPARPGPPAGPPPVAGRPAAARYRLADASGQLWEHADPDTLRAFVQGRNQAWLIPLATPFFSHGPATCASGRCR